MLQPRFNIFIAHDFYLTNSLRNALRILQFIAHISIAFHSNGQAALSESHGRDLQHGVASELRLN